MTDLSFSLNALEDVIKDFYSVSFFDFPLCLFSSGLRENSRINFITAKGRIEIEKQTGYKPKRFEKSTNDFYKDIHKQRIKICQNCKFLKSCGGIWKNYLDLYGDKEIEYLVKKHNCSK